MTMKSKHLVVQHLENVDWSILEQHADLIKGHIKGQSGVYALYNNQQLYYVGLASNLMKRLKEHLRDRHKGSWDRFSVYLTRHDEHMKELESLILRIVDPKGNIQSGKFKKSENIKAKLNKEMKAKQDQSRAKILGKATPKKKTPPAFKMSIQKHAPKKAVPVLFPYCTNRFIIKGMFRGVLYKATVRKDGRIFLNGEFFLSPSAAANSVRNLKSNGWAFWTFQNKKGEWVPLNELRKTGTRNKAQKRPTPTQNKKAPAIPLAGLFKKTITLRAHLKGTTYTAKARPAGTVVFNGLTFNSPSGAGRAATGRPTNGWAFWHYRNTKGEWVKLDTLR